MNIIQMAERKETYVMFMYLYILAKALRKEGRGIKLFVLLLCKCSLSTKASLFPIKTLSLKCIDVCGKAFFYLSIINTIHIILITVPINH